MAMDSIQEQAFKAASGNDVPLAALEFICIGTFLASLFLWAAWGMLDIYKGWANEKVREAAFVQFVIRAIILLLVCIWMFAS
ncbi:TIGR03758 family integrating conjugative element protein [Xenorhabdus bovienii]|uniref:TIGR03758 family integrating conjugative element protein n=1 Tax=Xenorhabdus bovienii TaxID=40576 RepID=UPI00237D0F34|nr:TIGR03758 family integrating conjugative element protein [Xenorhabdus bovienii]MDE1485150.1 TIGR03758 family integrating conjugative element protein [Xenorhabdus bovienii]MDE9476013.1 TIGR03758 family integrating conjugative element protein [Xenorhabdus bovienii]MDE9528781.1 TIGR03758 family integrating conjugative element protein [Xenorhabdus bovienii]